MILVVGDDRERDNLSLDKPKPKRTNLVLKIVNALCIESIQMLSNDILIYNDLQCILLELIVLFKIVITNNYSYARIIQVPMHDLHDNTT